MSVSLILDECKTVFFYLRKLQQNMSTAVTERNKLMQYILLQMDRSSLLLIVDPFIYYFMGSFLNYELQLPQQMCFFCASVFWMCQLSVKQARTEVFTRLDPF